MQRLTQRDGKGSWSLIGVPWGSLREGMVITRDIQEKLYGALYKLKDYEDQDLTLEQIGELRERDAVLLLENISGNNKDSGYFRFGTCPICKKRVSNLEGGNFCQNCGQRLKWED